MWLASATRINARYRLTALATDTPEQRRTAGDGRRGEHREFLREERLRVYRLVHDGEHETDERCTCAEATKRADPIAGDTDAGETRRVDVLSTACGRRLMTVLGSSNQTWASTTSVISEARVMTKYGRKA